MLIFCGKIASKKENYLASKKLSNVIIPEQKRMYLSFLNLGLEPHMISQMIRPSAPMNWKRGKLGIFIQLRFLGKFVMPSGSFKCLFLCKCYPVNAFVLVTFGYFVVLCTCHSLLATFHQELCS